MALYTRKEFYEKCGVSKGYLNVNIARGKIVLTGKLIDDAIPANAYFMEKRQEQKVEKKVERALQKPPKPVSEADVEDIDQALEDVDPDVQTAYNLGLEKKRLDNAKAEEDLALARMKKEKMAGDLIPTDLVLLIFASHFKSVTTSFHQAAENLITTFAKQNNLNRDAIAKMRGNLIKVINKAVKEGVDSSKREVRNLVSEYSQKRGRGEKE